MKKINLLKPNIVTGYLSNGKGQEITYLDVDPQLTKEKLDEDIANGAIHFRELSELLNRKPNRAVVIKAGSREEGLMAVSYLASIYNGMERIDPDEFDENEENFSAEKELEFEDFNRNDSCYPDEEDEEDPDDWENSDEWEETPWKMPLIEMSALNCDAADSINPFFNNGMGYQRAANSDSRVPYWRYTRKESICVIYDTAGGLGFCTFNPRVFKRYKGNRHLFLIVVDANTQMQNEAENEQEDADPFDDPFCPMVYSYETDVTQFVLEQSADIITLQSDKTAMEAYYQTILENWVIHYGFSLSKNFPLQKICRRILGMDSSGNRI